MCAEPLSVAVSVDRSAERKPDGWSSRAAAWWVSTDQNRLRPQEKAGGEAAATAESVPAGLTAAATEAHIGDNVQQGRCGQPKRALFRSNL